jgi:tetratricopeptide (TPR) repeat protein
VAALDDWAFVKEKLRAGSGEPLQTLAKQADDDPWRQRLRDPQVRKDRAALERLAEEEGVLSQPPGNLVLLSRALDAVKGRAAAVALLRRAQQQHPADFWINFELAVLLHEPATMAEAVGFYRAAVALRPESPVAHSNLGFALQLQGKLAEAVDACRKAIELKPDYAPGHNNLGVALYDQEKFAEAEAAFRKALELEPDLATAANNLGNALREQGKPAKAEAAHRKAITLQPDYADAHCDLGSTLKVQGNLLQAVDAYRKAIALKPNDSKPLYNLGNTLAEQGKLAEAVACYRKAIEFEPKPSRLAQVHNNLGCALRDQGDPAGAVACYRKALELDPRLPQAHLCLGNALRDQGDLVGAVSWYRKALECNPNYAEAYCNLGEVLGMQGEFAAALAARQTGHDLGSKRRDWRYPSEQWVRQAKRQVELENQLPDFLSGRREPADVGERIELADVCRCKQLYAASIRFYTEAFAADAKLADDMNSQQRYNAACVAALAGCGRGKDAADLSDEDRTRLRRQALTWLWADLKAWGRRVNEDPGKAHPSVAQTMQHWQGDSDFAGVRGPESLFCLPEAERQEWQKLWDDVAAVRQRAATRP